MASRSTQAEGNGTGVDTPSDIAPNAMKRERAAAKMKPPLRVTRFASDKATLRSLAEAR